MASITFENVRKIYPNGVKAVDDFMMEIADGEFVALVGPSGCGKSTTLRMIAGLESITGGSIHIGGRPVNNLPPKDRDIAMVFQSYALYPHMTVRQNLALGLELRKVDKAVIAQKIDRAAKMLDIADLLDRKPGQMSGGQQQRVALGRAIIREPSAFLLDEPLSNLDAKLRNQMRIEIINLHKLVGTTFIYVTHDQLEAMTMADRIVVMDGGFIQQIDTPDNLYQRPCNLFVAGFIGTPQMNFIGGEAARVLGLDARDDQTVGIRPEGIATSGEGDGFEGLVTLNEITGSDVLTHIKVAGQSLLAKLPRAALRQVGQRASFSINRQSVHVFDTKSGNRVE